MTIEVKALSLAMAKKIAHSAELKAMEPSVPATMRQK